MRSQMVPKADIHDFDVNLMFSCSTDNRKVKEGIGVLDDRDASKLKSRKTAKLLAETRLPS